MSDDTSGDPLAADESVAPPRSRTSRLRALVVDLEPLRRDRDYRFLWTGQLISGLGRQVTVVALPFQLYLLTRSTVAVGLVALVQLAAILGFSLGGGAIADALDRRRVLFVTQVGLALCSLAFVVLASQPSAPIVLYYVVAFASAGIGAIDQPARSSAIPRLVPPQRLPAAISLNQLLFQTVSVVGPALGGILLAVVGAAAAFAFDTVTFLAAIAAVIVIAPIPPHPSASRPSLATIAEGLRFVRGRRPVLGSFVVDLVAMIFGMPMSLFPALAIDVFMTGAVGVGLMTAAPAAGAFVMALFTGWTARVPYPGRAVYAAVAVWGAAIVAFGLATFSFPLALLCLAVAGGADVVSAVLRSVVVQFGTPDELRGRVMSVHTLVVTSGPRLGDAEAAAVAAVVGPQLSVISGGVLCLVGLAWVVRAFPEFGSYRNPVAPALATPT